jgi:hypothetical protein
MVYFSFPETRRSAHKWFSLEPKPDVPNVFQARKDQRGLLVWFYQIRHHIS